MKHTLLLLITFLFIFGSASGAYSQDVPLSMQAKLIIKIISMDRNMDRFGDPIVIGVSSDEMMEEFNALGGSLLVKDKELKAEKLGSTDEISKFKLVYIGKNWSDRYAAAAGKIKGNRVLAFGEHPDFAELDWGSVSFKAVSGKPKIVVNLANAKDAGTDFPAGFLKITVVVGGL